MIQNFDWVGTAAAALLGLAGGAVASQWRLRRAAKKSLRLPTQWPLQARPIANAEERRVWHWLHKVFYDHQILLKTPVTCFTHPQTREGGLHWHPLLRGMYCSFTVCSADGHVVGCIDVLKDDNGLSRSNRQFKRALLSRCSIAYSVVMSDRLPTMEEIRLDLLGEALPIDCFPPEDQAGIRAARLKLHSAIDRRRHMLRGDRGPLIPDGENEVLYIAEEGQPESEFYSGAWQQYDSFIAPLDGCGKGPD